MSASSKLPAQRIAELSRTCRAEAKRRRLTFHVSHFTDYRSRITHHAFTPETGIALVIVMISIFVLTILAAGFAFSMKVETKLAQHANNETELQWIGRSGVEYARWVLVLQGTCPLEPYDALSQPWATGTPSGLCATNGGLMEIQSEVHIGHGYFTWKMTDMERKFNINVANEAILQQALLLTGVDPSEMTPIINSILDWIDPDDNPRIQGTESEYYKTLDPPYEAKNGPIDDLAELLLIRGITPNLYWGPASTNHAPAAFQQRANALGFQQPLPYEVGLVDLFTPVAGGKLNINTASAAVLQLIPGIDSRVAEAIVAARNGEDDGSGLFGPYRSVTGRGGVNERVPEIAQLGPMVNLLNQFCDVRSRTFQVEVTAHVAGSERTFYATLVRNNLKDIQVLNFHWNY
jgi:general secretion pathway protein K